MDNNDKNIDQNFTEWMQYTRLKDKNGKEIYEEDIVKDLNGNILEVKWVQKSYYVGFLGALDHRENLEVIGNIYENPELLTTE